jgi:PDZ domain/Aspartyl protease
MTRHARARFCGLILSVILIGGILGIWRRAEAGRGANDSLGLVQFPQGESFVQLPLTIRANCPFLEVKVNGRGPFLFEVDTGSIDSPFASELTQDLGLDARVKQTVEVGLSDGLAVPINAEFADFKDVWPLIGRHIYGDIGFPVLQNFVVEFDYENDKLTLYEPKSYQYRGNGASFPASLEMGYDPQLEGEIQLADGERIATRFTLDTGAGGTVLSAPLVKKNRLLERITSKVPNSRSKPAADGVNGQVFQSVTARVSAIRLGKYTVEAPLVGLSTDTDGVFAMEDIGVNLGSNILRRFKVIIDYPQQRIILEPNSHFHDPFEADASGLELKAEGTDFRTILVRGIVPGSPAEESGLKENDVVMSIDGESTNKYALWQIQDIFKISGQTKRLTIRRGRSESTVVLKLRSLA